MANLVKFSKIELCKPDGLHIMDGSVEEDIQIKEQLVMSGVLIPLPKYDNCFLAHTDPRVIKLELLEAELLED